MTRPEAYVLLADGARFDGEACGAPGPAVGEVVFTTGMSGYQECVSDPSFHAQLITKTIAECGGNWAEAARCLGLQRGNLRRLADRLGIRPHPENATGSRSKPST